MRALANVSLKPRDRAAIEAAARMLRRRFPVSRVILFGSKARGRSHRDSDIDLLVLTKRKLSRREWCKVSHALTKLELKYDVLFGSVVVDSKEWFRGVSQALPLKAEVDREGVEV